MKRTGRNSSKTTEAETDNAMTLSVIEKAGNAPLAGENRACSNGESKKDKCNNDIPIAKSRIGTTQSLCNGSGQGKELLYLQRVRAHSLILPE